MIEKVEVLIVGMLFGASLDFAGFGSAKKLNRQFLGQDFTMLKVMFGSILLSASIYHGMLDLGVTGVDDILIPTLSPGIIAGGFLLGAALSIGGYCPGTALTAFAGGKLDAAVFFVACGVGYCFSINKFDAIFFKILDYPILKEHLTLDDWFGVQKIWILIVLALILVFIWKISAKFEK